MGCIQNSQGDKWAIRRAVTQNKHEECHKGQTRGPRISIHKKLSQAAL